ncbi:MAG: hypothetical protein ACK56I_28525 [bacterium]
MKTYRVIPISARSISMNDTYNDDLSLSFCMALTSNWSAISCLILSACWVSVRARLSYFSSTTVHSSITYKCDTKP